MPLGILCALGCQASFQVPDLPSTLVEILVGNGSSIRTCNQSLDTTVYTQNIFVYQVQLRCFELDCHPELAVSVEYVAVLRIVIVKHVLDKRICIECTLDFLETRNCDIHRMVGQFAVKPLV